MSNRSGLVTFPRWFVLRLAVALLGGVACAQDKPNILESASLPHVPRQEYTAKEMATMFGRPTNVVELLRNLKAAMDRDLILQPSFNDDTLLRKFFAGSSVRREPVSNISPYVAEDVFITIDDPHFPKMTVRLRQGHHVQSAHDSGAGRIPEHSVRTAFIEMNVASVPGFNVSAVRDVFGQGTAGIDSGEGTDGFRYTPTRKGGVFYDYVNGKSSDAPSPFMRKYSQKNAIFNVKLDSRDQDPRTIRNSDELRSIRLVIEEE